MKEGITEREEFISWVNDELTRRGFERDGDTERWKTTRSFQKRIIYINGQSYEEPSQDTHADFFIEVVGDGEVKDDKKTDPFVQFDIYVIQGGQKQDITQTICVYYDERELFTKILNNFK